MKETAETSTGRAIIKQRKRKLNPRVLYVGTSHRLTGIDLEALVSPSIFNRFTGSVNYHKPTPVCEIDYLESGLPKGMAIFTSPAAATTDDGDDNEEEDSTSSIIYLVGGTFGKTLNDLEVNTRPRFLSDVMSTGIYRYDPCEGPLATPKLVGELNAPKARPIVETLAEGKAYVFGGLDNPLCCSPFLELLDMDLSSSSSSSSMINGSLPRVLSEALDDSLLFGPFGRKEIWGYFVIGSRMFLNLVYNSPSIVCFDGAKGLGHAKGRGRWIRELKVSDIYDSFKSFPMFIADGRSVEVPGFKYHNVFGAEDYHVFLFTSCFEGEGGRIMRYFAGIVTKSAVLVCYQEITKEIFKGSKLSLRLQQGRCFFLDVGAGRVYAIVIGIDDERDCRVICLSKFTLSKLEVADCIVHQDIRGASPPPQETKFLRLSSVKDYNSCIFDHQKINDVNGVLIL